MTHLIEKWIAERDKDCTELATGTWRSYDGKTGELKSERQEVDEQLLDVSKKAWERGREYTKAESKEIWDANFRVSIENETLRAEIVRLNEKYDHQLLVKRDEEQRDEIEKLRAQLKDALSLVTFNEKRDGIAIVKAAEASKTEHFTPNGDMTNFGDAKQTYEYGFYAGAKYERDRILAKLSARGEG